MATRTTKTDRAYQKLKEHLELGTFTKGERLTEAKVSRVIGMGRGPVRESMLRLEAEGHLVSKGAFGGKYVQYVESYSRDELIERYELREVIDGMAARLASLNMTGRQIAELKRLDDCVAAELEAGNRPGRGEASRNFHDYLLNHCGNPLLEKTVQVFDLHPVVARQRELDDELLAAVAPLCVDGGTWYTASVSAIAVHNADEAEKHMRAWISLYIDALRRSE